MCKKSQQSGFSKPAWNIGNKALFWFRLIAVSGSAWRAASLARNGFWPPHDVDKLCEMRGLRA
jgi:hypothetical protein